MKPWFDLYAQLKPAHKYAINTHYLGDDHTLAWSNLGYWDGKTHGYIHACCQLADRLAQSIQLSAQDVLLDLGCGQGASLLYWQQHYAVKQLIAVELQQACIENIQQHLSQCPTLYQSSFLELAEIQFAHHFDAVVCIDAAYHGNLSKFLRSVATTMKPQSRLGFHYLIWSEKFKQLNVLQQQRYKYLLKAADVNSTDLMTYSQLELELQQHDFSHIQIEDLSTAVFGGFSHYMQGRTDPKFQHRFSFDYVKILMTAKLCQRLYNEGIVKYVQVSAKYQTVAQ